MTEAKPDKAVAAASDAAQDEVQKAYSRDPLYRAEVARQVMCRLAGVAETTSYVAACAAFSAGFYMHLAGLSQPVAAAEAGDLIRHFTTLIFRSAELAAGNQ